MNQQELDALPDVTTQFGMKQLIIEGRLVNIPVPSSDIGALFIDVDDGVYFSPRERQSYLVGYHKGLRVKRRSE